MSYVIMPPMPLSMAAGLHKTWVYQTILQSDAASRGNASVGIKAFPTCDFEFDLNYIQGNEALASSTYAQIVGTHMACGGRNSLFLFTDPQDSVVSYGNSGMLNVTPGAAAPMGLTGDGVSTQFQPARCIGGMGWDVIQNPNGSITVQVNGSTVVPSSVSSTGVVTFATAPPSGATITWTGAFRSLCRFQEDSLDATRVFTTNSGTDSWTVNSVKFSSEFV
jgi:hypothetical protein